jgi:hypothetical protein
MFSANELANKISAYASGDVSLNEFEDWFREASENVHLQGDSALEDFVFAVEALFSERYFDGLSKRNLRTELQEVARRFAVPFVLSIRFRVPNRPQELSFDLSGQTARLTAGSAAPVDLLDLPVEWRTAT